MAATSGSGDSKNRNFISTQPFINDCQRKVREGSISNPGAEKDVRLCLSDFIGNYCQGTYRLENAAPAIKEVCNMHQAIPSLVADIFSVFDSLTLSQQQTRNDDRQRFIKLLPQCYEIVPEGVLKERLDVETLTELKILESKEKFNKNYIKIKTKMFYKQLKFNLLREESEGFSKLMTELHQDFSSESAPSARQMLETIQSLIGCFNIDPNRVLDIILEMFEKQLEHEKFFCEFLTEYSADHLALADLLGFKFKYYVTENQPTPTSLYKLSALLIYNELLPCHAIYQQLGPHDDEILELHKKELADSKSYVRKTNTVSLQAENEDAKEDEVVCSAPADNQKIGVIQYLLEIGDWTHAKQLIDRLPAYFATSNCDVAKALCKIGHKALEPLYSKIEKNITSCAVSDRRPYDSTSKAIESIRVNTVLELREKLFPVLCYLGPHASNDSTLLFKICRLCSCFLKQREKSLKEKGSTTDEYENIYRGILTIVDEVLLPSLSLLPSNYPLSEEIWSVLKYYTYQNRYRMYGQWKNESYIVHPKLMRAKADCLKKSKHSMRRLAKENVKTIGRQLGKLSHSNPTILFEYILSQIQTFDNLIGPVADSLKYLSSLSADLLAYIIIEALASPEKERMKHDDTNISTWLQSLANFSATIFKKYPIDLSGILQYVANQLKANKSLDLLVLREILQRMANVEVSEEITLEQLECLYGGELLKSEGGNFLTPKNIKRSCQRLRESLIDNNLDIALSLLMAQQRSCIVFTTREHSEETHVKLLGKVYDQCNDTLYQFTAFVTTQVSLDELEAKLPSLEELITTYNVTPDVGFALYRPYLTHSIAKVNEKESFQTAIEQILRPLETSLTAVKLCNDLTLQCYLIFWTLQKSDLTVPEAAYDRQIQLFKQQKQGLENSNEGGGSKRKREMDRCLVNIDKLKEEEKKQREHVDRVREYLKKAKDTWFASKTSRNATVSEFLQVCIFPRACFSAVDALYCAEFVKTLHHLETPHFSTLIFFDRVFCDMTYCVTSRTENEAHRYGRFLCSLLETIMNWHKDETNFDKECAATPGFITNFRATVKSASDHLDYQNYRHVVHKWHFSITKAMVACLESNNYIQIRNALIILTRILPHYPKVVKFGLALERRIDRMCQEEKEKRPDLHVLGTGYSGQLKAKKKFWIQEEQFHARESQKKNLAAKVNGVKKDGKNQNSDSKGSTKKQEAYVKKSDAASTNSPIDKQSPPSPKLDEKRQRTVKMTKVKEIDNNSSKVEQTAEERKATKRKIDKTDHQSLSESKIPQKQSDIMSMKKREEYIEKVKAEKDVAREKERSKAEIKIVSSEQSITKETSRQRLKESQSDQWVDSRELSRSEVSRNIVASEKEKRRKLVSEDEGGRSSIVQKRNTESGASPNNLFGCAEVKRGSGEKKRRIDSSPRESPQYFDDRRSSRNDNSHRQISPPRRISPNEENFRDNRVTKRNTKNLRREHPEPQYHSDLKRRKPSSAPFHDSIEAEDSINDQRRSARHISREKRDITFDDGSTISGATKRDKLSKAGSTDEEVSKREKKMKKTKK